VSSACGTAAARATSRPHRLEEAAHLLLERQQRQLDLRREAQLFFDAGRVERLPVEARVLDRDRRLRRKRLERGPRRRREQPSLLPAVQIEHANRPRVPYRIRVVDDMHQTKRDADDVANAIRPRLVVRLLQVHFREILNNLLATRNEHLFRDLAHGEGARQRDTPLPAGELGLEPPRLVGQHDEAALGPGHLDGGVQHERQDLLEHAGAAKLPQAVEHRRDLTEASADGRTGLRIVGVGLDEKPQLDAARLAETNPVAMGERLLRDAKAVDERAAPGPAIPDHVPAILMRDLSVIA
jgi:hypothetical protein